MMGISALDVFEELRFIWELLLAEKIGRAHV